MQGTKLDLKNGLTAELFSKFSDRIRTDMLIKSCGKTVQTRFWGVYVRLDGNDAYPPELLRDELSALVLVRGETIFLVMMPWLRDPAEIQRAIEEQGPPALLKLVEYVTHGGRLYSTAKPVGRLILGAVINNVKPSLYALMNQ